MKAKQPLQMIAITSFISTAKACNPLLLRVRLMHLTSTKRQSFIDLIECNATTTNYTALAVFIKFFRPEHNEESCGLQVTSHATLFGI